MTKFEKFVRILTSSVFVLVILLMSLYMIMKSPEQTLLVGENRYIAGIPAVSSVNLLSGKYFLDWETYFKDRFFLRTELISAFVELKKNAEGRITINDVTFGNDGILLNAKDSILTHETHLMLLKSGAAEKTAGYINETAEYCRSLGILYCLFTFSDREQIFSGYFPQYAFETLAPPADEQSFFNLLKDVRHVDLTNDLLYADMPFYRSDHHWTSEGAYQAYRRIIQTTDELMSGRIADKSITEDITQGLSIEKYYGYNGSLSRRVAYTFLPDDIFELMIPAFPSGTRFIINGKEVSNIFERAFIDGKRSYLAYTGGDYSEIVSETNRNWLPTLMLIGSSYNNVLETLLPFDFGRVVSLDPRYFDRTNGECIRTFIKKWNPDIVITVANNTLLWDTDAVFFNPD